MTVKVVYEARVCTDCLMAAAGISEDEMGEKPEFTPLSRLQFDDSTIVPGDEYGFSNTRCEGCESPYAGDRHWVSVLAH